MTDHEREIFEACHRIEAMVLGLTDVMTVVYTVSARNSGVDLRPHIHGLIDMEQVLKGMRVSPERLGIVELMRDRFEEIQDGRFPPRAPQWGHA